MTTRKTTCTVTALALASAMLLTSCAAGEGSAVAGGDEDGLRELNLDYATYNLLSLVIKDQGWLEDELDIPVNWVFSAGSNKANESLRADAIDFGTTGGGPALQARANDAPTKVVYLTNATNSVRLLAPAGSGIDSVNDLAGKTVAATRGTDPYFFLLQALQEHGVALDAVQVENLQHADGRTAMENGTVDAWSGLDPILAAALLDGAEVVYENADFISPVVLNVREAFAEEHPDVTQTVIDTYERARAWVLEHPDEALEIFADEAGLAPDVAELALSHTEFAIDPVPRLEELSPVLTRIGGFMVESGDVKSQQVLDEALETLIDPTFAERSS